MALIKFVRNYDDLSTDRGYQFKFYCDKCGNGFLSNFENSTIGTAGSLLRAADYDEELAASHARAKADAAREQLHERARATDYASKIDMTAGSVLRAPAPSSQQQPAAVSAVANCSSCGADVGRGKFCPECGTPVRAAKPTCGACGHQPEGSPKFFSE